MKRCIISVIFCAGFAVGARAQNAPSDLCSDISIPKNAVIAHGGKWTELTPDQWQFVRGVFVLNPNTPPGLPYGDKAVLAQMDGDGGIVFFIDGDRACTPMALPSALVTMIDAVGTATISHEGKDQ
jgi:hypothetical protein